MSGKSSIQWTDTTWNPTTGCTRVSAGCDHCYAFQLHDQRHIAWKRARWSDAPAQYHKPFSQVQLLPDRLRDPLRWRTPRRVFVDSMSDLFHEAVPDDYIAQVFAVMAMARRHTFQILTKRPGRMRDFMRSLRDGRYLDVPASAGADLWGTYTPMLPNVWLGTSVENQAAADERIPLLLDTPAAVRFLSCEPLLGPVYLRAVRSLNGAFTPMFFPSNPLQPLGTVDALRAGLHWVIVGGESGPHARIMEWHWLGSLIEQCEAAGVPVFVKQMGSVWAKFHGYRDRHGGDINEWPDVARIRQFPEGHADA